MNAEAPQIELARLRKEQAKTRRDEVFGGLSSQERFAYDNKQHRIHELEDVLFGEHLLHDLVLSGYEDGPRDYSPENSCEEDADS